MIKSKGYDGSYTLMDTQTGMPVELNAQYGDRDGTVVRVTGGRAPHNPASTGRVYVQAVETGQSYEFYPSVYGLSWDLDDNEVIGALSNFGDLR